MNIEELLDEVPIDMDMTHIEFMMDIVGFAFSFKNQCLKKAFVIYVNVTKTLVSRMKSRMNDPQLREED